MIVDAAVHVTRNTELDGDARARVDEIAASLESGIGDLSSDEVGEWRRQADDAERSGTFFFCEPAAVVTTTLS